MSKRKGSRTRPERTTPPVIVAPAPEVPPVSRSRERVLRLAALTVTPILFFLLLELSLRLFGYGQPTSFFLPAPGRETVATNQKFGWRFFPPAIARTPVPSLVASPKAPGVYRIFVLGSSAAMGEPEPAFSFGRILEVMLNRRYPGTTFEVVNTAMTAINSHVLLPIARDCAAAQPDLFVVYEGNNEVVGPYGPGTVLGAFSKSGLAIRTGIWLRATRTGQLVRDTIQRFAGKGQPLREWRGMETFLGRLVTADDSRMEDVYGHFRRNLTSLGEIAREAGAGIVYCTVATNLKDTSPFASVHRADLSTADRSRWEASYGRGLELARTGRQADAIESYLEAERIDDRFAELQYRLGRAYLAMGSADLALKHLTAARDLDALRFRTDSRLNRIIREVAAEGRPNGAGLVDAEQAFAASEKTVAGVPGDELFYEHVHMNFEGNHLLAASVYQRIAEMLPEEIRRRAVGPGEPPGAAECADALALTGWNRYRMSTQITSILSRPPFTAQADHEAAIARWQESVAAMDRAYNTPRALGLAAGVYAQAVQRAPGDLLLGANHASLLHAMGDYKGAEAGWRTLLRAIPDIVLWHEELGQALLYQEKVTEAIAEFREALRIWPGRALDHSNIGVALERVGRQAEAIEEFREALRLSPGNLMAHLNLGSLLGKQGNRREAMEHFKAAVADSPEHAGARVILGDELASEGKLDEALTQYREAIRYDPGSAQAYTQLGIVLADNPAKAQEAAGNLKRALELDPDLYPARLRLAILHHDMRQYAECEAELTEVIRRHPGQAEPHQLLASLYQETGRPDMARQELERARTPTRPGQ